MDLPSVPNTIVCMLNYDGVGSKTIKLDFRAQFFPIFQLKEYFLHLIKKATKVIPNCN